MHSMDVDEKPKRYCIRGKHAAIICAVVLVTGLAVGLGVGLSQPASDCAATPAPTDPPVPPTQTPPPPTDRGPCKASNDTSGDWKNFRLPSYIEPTHYDLHLEPDLGTDLYTGTVGVHLKLHQASAHLWMHIRETFVSGVPTLKLVQTNEDGTTSKETPIGVKGCFEYKTHEYVVAQAESQLAVTQANEHYVLTLPFQGWLNGSLVGFYRVTYTDENGQLRKIAATDHEPTDARKSFPCFDEPNKKTTYKISITHDSNYNALSNMPVEKVEDAPNGKKKTSFDKSVKMSTYLACWAVHQFTSVERTSKSGIPLKIWAQPAQIHTATYAADVTKIIFDYFEEYFDMPYSISKLDKIAIPDFGTGAMENWGLITYRETNLLFDENESSSYNKQRVASVISHELVHQWFGNIVTMDWWDDLWLNEGFASFFEYVGVEEAEPSWGMRDIMLISDVLPVMVDDALLTSHPIIVDVSTPAEITSVFDSISYSKGASILRMLEDRLGKDTFRDGCRVYLKRFPFQNAKTSDFWQAMADNSGVAVADIMDTWTKQMGYPVLELSVAGTTAKLTQKRFLLDPKADPTQPPVDLGYKWTIPVKWQSVGSNRNGSLAFDKASAEVTIVDYNPTNDGLIKVNNDHLGFYRVNHNTGMWTQISQQLVTNYEEFDAADRTSFIDDVFALARANSLDYGVALDMTKYLSNETAFIAWDTVSSSIAYVRQMLADDTELYPKFQKLLRGHVQGIAAEMGWEDVGNQTERLLREVVLSIACQMGDEHALANATHIFNQWMAGDIERVGVNLRLLVYRYGMKKANEATWQKMFQKYRDTTLAQEKDKLLYGLASVENVTLLSYLLEASRNESVIRSQDLFTVVRYVAGNTYGKSMAWDWATLNWDYLVNRYTINDRSLGRLLSSISTSYNTEVQLWKMKHFFGLTPNAGAGTMPRKQALETVGNNIEWMNQNLNEIRTWLNNNVP
ncbi:glutamyl aminopeptidase [Engraulis encrasicolus]|uniref:glutamyl aminopeptidase n=1 Tax=Engraulis encrasicolus TaxID=184585 RepID=UPI002FCF26E0